MAQDEPAVIEDPFVTIYDRFGRVTARLKDGEHLCMINGDELSMFATRAMFVTFSSKPTKPE